MAKERLELPEDIIFYCKDCRQIVSSRKAGRKHVYQCMICGTKNVAFGTEKSVKGFYHLKDVLPEPIAEEESKEIPSAKV